ncbi:flavin reductase family protein [Peribacillus simplex]|uniref:Flavin reductase family protein n=2 Tax=Peribacillus TaxID=2675229 RepID=A0AA90T1F0_9BACI|nr:MULTISPECIES: flavin reductase family protein [Peribacillus]MDP1419158.1 flavin reductase family protein [Peribacillus simplex]MDP1452204.1 flavin reductase family protein [Peribacillus frigoritolerans]
MISVNPESLTERDNYKFLTGSIIPRPIALVTTKSETGTINIAPFSFFNIVSSNPPMISISVQRKEGVSKDTARNAIQTGEFVVHITDENNVVDANRTAKELPSDESELGLTNFTQAVSDKVSVPGLQEAKVRFECTLEHAIPLAGSKNKPGCDLLIGKIVCYHIEQDIYHNGRIDQNGLKPVARLAGHTYTKLGELFEIERP